MEEVKKEERVEAPVTVRKNCYNKYCLKQWDEFRIVPLPFPSQMFQLLEDTLLVIELQEVYGRFPDEHMERMGG